MPAASRAAEPPPITIRSKRSGTVAHCLAPRGFRYSRRVAATEAELLEALRAGDEDAFAALVRVARMYVSSQATAEEVAQETWLGVLNGLDRFEGRSSLKTWIFRILANRAKTRAQREGRSVPFSSLPEFTIELNEPAIEPERFQGPDQRWPGNWVSFPRSW